MSFLDHEGWESPKHEYRVQSDRIMITKCKKETAKTILKQTRHSLQPDMALGWKPKLPSCPLPLSYFNVYNQQLMAHIPKDDRFKIVYLGKRSLNSVQVNQQYSYFWRYRQRYSLNIAIIQQAVKSVGNNHLNFSQQISKAVTQKQLSFDSSFQSGNLQMAVKVKPHEYDLYLRSDTNTKGHTNWYYFKVSNKDFVGTAQFNICNIGKTKTLYNKGMKPYVFQVKSENSPQSKSFKQKWSQQKTFDVCLVERYCRYGFEKKTFQLQFKYHFKKPNTEIYLAYGIPYTYSQLQQFIKEITENHPKIVKCQKMCESLGGLNLPLLTISSQEFMQKKQQRDQRTDLGVNFSDNLLNKGQIPLEQNKKKRAVLITARIHPGQSNASHVLQGFVRQLLENNQISKKIRQMYVFYIVPMLNPDGVVIGNFRTSYSGKDLNRQFNKLNKSVYPEIFALDELAIKLKQKYKRKLEFYFDFHGHSSKKNLFCYGPEYNPSNILFFKCRTFAKIIQETNCIFSYRKSIFQVNQHKKTTARAHMLWSIKIPMTYTFQISNGLYENKQEKNIQLDKQSLLEAGKTVFKGFARYISLETRNFGCYAVKAKVDSGIRSRKMISQKSLRQKSLNIESIFPNKMSVQLTQPHLSRNHQQSLRDIEQNSEFQKYIRQIKKESVINDQIEGGSDSQGSEQDLSKQEISKLHQFVKTQTQQSRQYDRKVYNFKIKPIKKNLKERKMSVQEIDQDNKQNSRTENERAKIRSNSGIETGRRLYRMSQKDVAIKKPPLPIPILYQKVVLCQKKFMVEF